MVTSDSANQLMKINGSLVDLRRSMDKLVDIAKKNNVSNSEPKLNPDITYLNASTKSSAFLTSVEVELAWQDDPFVGYGDLSLVDGKIKLEVCFSSRDTETLLTLIKMLEVQKLSINVIEPK